MVRVWNFGVTFQSLPKEGIHRIRPLQPVSWIPQWYNSFCFLQKKRGKKEDLNLSPSLKHIHPSSVPLGIWAKSLTLIRINLILSNRNEDNCLKAKQSPNALWGWAIITLLHQNCQTNLFSWQPSKQSSYYQLIVPIPAPDSTFFSEGLMEQIKCFHFKQMTSNFSLSPLLKYGPGNYSVVVYNLM